MMFMGKALLVQTARGGAVGLSTMGVGASLPAWVVVIGTGLAVYGLISIFASITKPNENQTEKTQT
jgi:hypothetical protein